MASIGIVAHGNEYWRPSERYTSDGDRRTVNLSLTPAGAAEHRRLETLLNTQVDRVVSRVAAAERSTVTRALQLLLDAYSVELAEEPMAEARASCAVA